MLLKACKMVFKDKACINYNSNHEEIKAFFIELMMIEQCEVEHLVF